MRKKNFVYVNSKSFKQPAKVLTDTNYEKEQLIDLALTR